MRRSLLNYFKINTFSTFTNLLNHSLISFTILICKLSVESKLIYLIISYIILSKHALFFSFEFHLNQGASYDRKLLEITHFVNLLADTLAQVKYKENVKKDFENNRVMFERSKLEEAMRQEIEEKEKRDFIEQWKMKNKMKGKKQGKKKDKVDNKRK